MLGGLHFFVNRTRLGMAIRAVAQDPDTASLMGVPVNRVIALTFFVGGALGGLAGVLFGIHYSLVNPYSGFIPGMKAFTAAVLGGIGNIPGAMVGGMMLGMLEAFAASYLSLMTDGAFGAEYKDVFAFLVLILILIFRPKGLLGETVREEQRVRRFAGRFGALRLYRRQLFAGLFLSAIRSRFFTGRSLAFAALLYRCAAPDQNFSRCPGAGHTFAYPRLGERLLSRNCDSDRHLRCPGARA